MPWTKEVPSNGSLCFVARLTKDDDGPGYDIDTRFGIVSLAYNPRSFENDNRKRWLLLECGTDAWSFDDGDNCLFWRIDEQVVPQPSIEDFNEVDK